MNNIEVKKGDVISNESKISWNKMPQAIKLRDIANGEIFIISNSSLDRHDKLSEYLHVQKKLATDQKFERDSTVNSALYIEFKSNDGESQKIELSQVSSFFGLPRGVNLCRDDNLLCEDFRALQADFILSKRLLTKINRELEPSDEEYVLMFDSLLKENHRGLIHSIDEIEMIIRIK